MRVVPLPFARLPNAMVRLLPVRTNVLSENTEHVRRFSIERALFLAEPSDCVDDFAVGIELDLFGRCVPDAYRPRRQVAVEVGELFFSRWDLTVNVVKNAELWPSETCRVEQPVYERARFFVVAEAKQRPNRERGVSQPAEAIVPIQI